MTILHGHIKWYIDIGRKRGLLVQSLLFLFSVDKQNHKTELTDVITQENERKPHSIEELKKFQIKSYCDKFLEYTGLYPKILKI